MAGTFLRAQHRLFLPEVRFTTNGKRYIIDRIQNENHELTGGFAKTSRKRPPFCIHPMEAMPGVTTVGKLELLEFLKNRVEKDVLLFCNGPWCDQSPRAIRALVKFGYPVNKIFYYRDGMQDWPMLGLAVEVPAFPAAAKPAATPPAQGSATR